MMDCEQQQPIPAQTGTIPSTNLNHIINQDVQVLVHPVSILLFSSLYTSSLFRLFAFDSSFVLKVVELTNISFLILIHDSHIILLTHSRIMCEQVAFYN
jgi:uncharacterized membrane protein YesL